MILKTQLKKYGYLSLFPLVTTIPIPSFFCQVVSIDFDVAVDKLYWQLIPQLQYSKNRVGEFLFPEHKQF